MPESVIAGRYRLQELLGRGGMSEVWHAEDLELGRAVAIKLLAPDADRARFEREARAVASLAHPNVMQLYDYGESEGRPYMVLEYVPGGTLEDRLRDRRPRIGRLLVRRDALSHARRAASVRVERSDGARADAPRLAAASSRAVPDGCARTARVDDDARPFEGSLRATARRRRIARRARR